MGCIKLKKLEGLLSRVEGLDQPKVHLEQYNTSSHIVAQIIHTIQSRYDDLNNKLICDMGTGSGIIGLGALLAADCRCVGIDIDDDALSVCQLNIEAFEMNSKFELIKGDVLSLNTFYGSHLFDSTCKKPFDITIMNPPFGTKDNWGIDMKFLSAACQVTSGVVYSLHKTSTRQHIEKVINNDKMTCQVIAQIHFDIPQCYKFHKKVSQDVEVDLLRITPNVTN